MLKRFLLLGLLFGAQAGFTPSASAGENEVASIYRTVLGREASPAEIAYWESTGLQGNPLLNTIMASAQGADVEAVARYRAAEAQKGIPKNPDPKVKEMLEQAEKDGQAAREALLRGEDTLPYAGKYLPKPSNPGAGGRSVLWGAWIEGITTAPGATFQDIQSFNSMTGKKAQVEGLTTWWYVDADWGDFDTLYNNPQKANANWVNEVHARGATPMILWQPLDPLQLPACEDPAYLERIKRFSPKNIAKGNFDPYIRKWAMQIKAWGKPLHIRMMHELNYRRDLASACEFFTNWDAELVIKGERINSPGDSVEAWKHIVDLFRAEGANNVQWVWSVLSYPSAGYGGTNPVALKSIYPGDQYVDWIGIECYNFKNEEWLSCRDRMSGIYNEAAALSGKVPLLVAEMGAYEDSRKAAWLTDALSDSSPNAIQKMFPRITAIMYWNDSRNDGLWLKSSQGSIDAVKSALTGATYKEKSLRSESMAGQMVDPEPQASPKNTYSSDDIYAEITGDSPSAVESRLMATSFSSGLSPRDIRIEISNSTDVRSKLTQIYQKEYGKAPSRGALKAMSDHIAKGGTVQSVEKKIQSFAPGSPLVVAAEKEEPIGIVVAKTEDTKLDFGSVSSAGKQPTGSGKGINAGRNPASAEENPAAKGTQEKTTGSQAESGAASSAAAGQVRQLYREVLGRDPDSGGLDYWAKQIESGAMTYEQVKAAMQNSEEGRQRAGSKVKSAI